MGYWDEHPMSFVEQQGFHEFMAETQPLFKFYTRNTLRSDVEKMYEAEKAKLLKLLGKNSSRIAITTDMWSADCQNKGYMAITAHFIDDDWNLQFVKDTSEDCDAKTKLDFYLEESVMVDKTNLKKFVILGY
ncbi:hypothetical protein AHAS_Ahas15G0392200 [Arachis hypogaea]